MLRMRMSQSRLPTGIGLQASESLRLNNPASMQMALSRKKGLYLMVGSNSPRCRNGTAGIDASIVESSWVISGLPGRANGARCERAASQQRCRHVPSAVGQTYVGCESERNRAAMRVGVMQPTCRPPPLGMQPPAGPSGYEQDG